jgi:hypothetical protein
MYNNNIWTDGFVNDKENVSTYMICGSPRFSFECNKMYISKRRVKINVRKRICTIMNIIQPAALCDFGRGYFGYKMDLVIRDRFYRLLVIIHIKYIMQHYTRAHVYTHTHTLQMPLNKNRLISMSKDVALWLRLSVTNENNLRVCKYNNTSVYYNALTPCI